MYLHPNHAPYRRLMHAERHRRARNRYFLLTVASMSLLGATVFFSSWYW